MKISCLFSVFLGMQGHLWTETVRNPDQMFAMIFPRLLALAERAWHKASWEDITDRKKRDEMMKADWVKFAGALGNRELVRLDKMGVQYRVPPPGARSEAGLIKGAVSCMAFQLIFLIMPATRPELRPWTNIRNYL